MSKSKVPVVMGLREISIALGVSYERARQISLRSDLPSERRFPAPMAELECGRIWWREEVTAWALKVGRQIKVA